MEERKVSDISGINVNSEIAPVSEELRRLGIGPSEPPIPRGENMEPAGESRIPSEPQIVSPEQFEAQEPLRLKKDPKSADSWLLEIREKLRREQLKKAA